MFDALNAWETSLMEQLGEWGGGLLDPVMTVISRLGDGGLVMILAAAILLCFKKTRRTGISAALALIFGMILVNGILKPLIGRVRPYDFDPSLAPLIPLPDDASFPSGHALAAFETAVPILRYHGKWGIAALVFAGLMAFSRVYVLVHYPSDVIAGAVIGVLTGICGILLTEKIAQKSGGRL